jgi:hypothetical protein
MEPQGGRWAARLTWAFVLLGLALRVYHYTNNYSIWHDEAVVIINVQSKTYAELLGPLAYTQAAPPLYLWLTKALGAALGDSPYIWRLPGFAASCLALLLMVPVARRALAPDAVPWALFLYAIADRLLWHTAECKPYALDVLCAVGVTLMYLRTKHWPLPGRAALFAAVAPVVLWTSYPGCFVYGGLLMSLVPDLWANRRRWTAWAGCVGLAAVTACTFLLLYLGPVRAQRNDDLIWYWTVQLPDWSRPWSVPHWTLYAGFEMFRFCVLSSGGLLFWLFFTGALVLWRAGKSREVLLLAVPILLALLAAYGRYYPFGHARLELYAVPAVVMLMAAGVPPVLRWLQRLRAPGPLWRRAFGWLGAVWLVFMLVEPSAETAYRAVRPWARPDSAHAAAFVLQHRRPDEAVAWEFWEYDYYMRDLPEADRGKLLSLDRVQHDRVWAINVGKYADQRTAYVRQLPGWAVVEEHEFKMITVLLMQRITEHDHASVATVAR